MNLSEVLNVALPELPAKRIKGYPRLHPKVMAREQIEGGVPTMVVMVSGGVYIMRFTPDQWKLVQLFNGERSYSEVVELYQQETGIAYGEEEVREYVESLDEGGLWYKTSLELSTTAGEKLADERRRRAKRTIDLSNMTFSTWDPDEYLGKLHRRLSFVFTKWFTVLTLGAFALMVLIFASGWSEIWRDTVRYYTFTDKSGADLAEFWLLFCGLGYFHECAHGLTCKHFGGSVHRMGFMLVYLSPAFFCDVGEVYVYGGKWPRVAAIIAGIWTELIFCSAASIVWWGTPAGSPVHDFAYKIMLITGVAVVLINLNPLIKLDGYYLFGELVGTPTIKESSTEYLSTWVKRNVFRMPVDVPFLRPQRRWLFAGYALISGLYSYVVLFAAVRFVYNIFFRFSAQWAFLPALLLGFLILKARLRSSLRFMKDFYLDRQQSLRQLWTRPYRALTASLGIILVLFAPVWRQTVSGRFVLEAEQRATIRAAIPGQITEVLAEEGTPVQAGAPLFVLRNLRLEAESDNAQAALRGAEAQAREAQANYANLGAARAEHATRVGRYHSVVQQVSALRIASPISGVTTTPRLKDRLGSFVQEGDVLTDVDDARTLKARIFIPEFQIQRVRPNAPVSLKLESLFQPIRGSVSSMEIASSRIAPGLAPEEKYKGAAAPSFYVATVLISNSGRMMRPGMSGDAKIQIERQSIAGFVRETVLEFLQRKIW
ncbi:MAG: HlyD family efflux transporter periplasmic adaptor subunit [Terriglobales bacterium]|jgi:putative peptide zinc metalloprotease protein